MIELTKLNESDSREAIVKPIQVANCPVSFADESVERMTSAPTQADTPTSSNSSAARSSTSSASKHSAESKGLIPCR